MDKLERSILNQSYDHFVKSSDYNGLAIYNLFCKEDWNCIEKAIIQLITNGVLEITDQSCSYNPMIIHHPFLDIEGQISIIKNGNNNTSIVLYPSASYLKAHRDVSDLSDKPFERMLALGIPQFKSIFFSWDVLHMYASDPRYTFIFNDYHGEISSSPDLGKEQFIHLRTFGVGRCNDNFVVVAFPKDLREMSPINQGIWYAKMIDEQSACKGLRQYYDNVFGGCWKFPNTVYRSILLEMSNVNVLTNHIYGKNFFRKEYKKEDLEGFDMLSMPTEKEYNDFVSILEKLTISNINVAFYKNVGIDVKDDRSLSYMEEFLNNVLPKYKDDILTPLKELRKIRQTPAHKITNNNYDVAYFTKQQLLAKGVYDSIYMLRRLFESHPDVGDQCELSDTSYIEL